MQPATLGVLTELNTALNLLVDEQKVQKLRSVDTGT
jgi:hypothetical protein